MLLLLPWLATVVGMSSRSGPRVVGMRGEAGFKSATLVWGMEGARAWDRKVQLSFCENQVSQFIFVAINTRRCGPLRGPSSSSCGGLRPRLSSYFSNIRNLVFDQSSPVQPVSESRGGSLSVTEEDGEGNPRV